MNTIHPSVASQIAGCLFGGAVGDALGAPVEFMSHAEIVVRFGAGGIRDFVPAYGRVGSITDDTQMTLFTGEGLLCANTRHCARGICNTTMMVHHAYLRWLKTQDERPSRESQSDYKLEVWPGSWLSAVPALWARRAPGHTCLSALREAKHVGEAASNNSKGCGGVMRAAPVGLVARRDLAFDLGCEIAALTHGHASGYLSAGFLALMIAEITAGTSLPGSIAAAKASLIQWPQHEEVLEAVEKSEALALARAAAQSIPRSLGEGWIAEEALGIALYCAIVAPNFEEAVVLAVNHSGDSDSTGSITGNICGAIYGVKAIPARWINEVELRDEISAIANDLAALRRGELDEITDALMNRYPG